MLKGLFNPENSFWEFMTNVSNILFAGLIWLISCIPIITIGAATTALYEYTLEVADNSDTYVIKSFFKSFKNHFIKATILWLLILLGASFLMIDAYVCLQIATRWGKVLFFMIISIAIIYILMCLYIFPVLAFFQEGIKETIKKAFVMSVGNLPLTVVIIMILAIASYIIYTLPYLVFALPAYAIYLTSYFYLSIFKKKMTII